MATIRRKAPILHKLAKHLLPQRRQHSLQARLFQDQTAALVPQAQQRR